MERRCIVENKATQHGHSHIQIESWEWLSALVENGRTVICSSGTAVELVGMLDLDTCTAYFILTCVVQTAEAKTHRDE